jgi:hypothetical protein
MWPLAPSFQARLVEYASHYASVMLSTFKFLLAEVATC